MSQNVSGQLLWEPKKSPQKNDLERIFFWFIISQLSNEPSCARLKKWDYTASEKKNKQKQKVSLLIKVLLLIKKTCTKTF